MQPHLLLLIAAAAFPAHAALQPSAAIQSAHVSRVSLRNESPDMAAATGVPDLQSRRNERQARVSSFMATQTDTALAVAYTSIQADRTSASAFLQTATPSDRAKAKEGFGDKMKGFFKKMQIKAQKKKDESASTVSASDNVQPTSTVNAS